MGQPKHPSTTETCASGWRLIELLVPVVILLLEATVIETQWKADALALWDGDSK